MAADKLRKAMDIYSQILRPCLFCLDAETAHHLALAALRLTPQIFLRTMFGPVLEKPVQLFGLEFRNPVGLAAGMDKDAVALSAWETMGFGFVEVGTITAHAQSGNPKPRCFRYPEQQGIINRMGFNNSGAEVIAKRLEKIKLSGRWPKVPIGLNIGKSKITPLAEAPADYAKSFRLLLPFGDYFVVNVSSPNTPGLRELQDRESLLRIVDALREIDSRKPLLVKIAPDLSEAALREIAQIAEEKKLAGLVATNTTLDHSSIPASQDEAGGLSGQPLHSKTTHVIRILRANTGLPIIASGGVMSVACASEKFDAGASLVQIYTGLIYQGPRLIRDIVHL